MAQSKTSVKTLQIFMVVCTCSNIRAIRVRQEVDSPQVSKCLNIIIHTTICVGSEDAEIQGRAFVR